MNTNRYRNVYRRVFNSVNLTFVMTCPLSLSIRPSVTKCYREVSGRVLGVGDLAVDGGSPTNGHPGEHNKIKTMVIMAIFCYFPSLSLVIMVARL